MDGAENRCCQCLRVVTIGVYNFETNVTVCFKCYGGAMSKNDRISGENKCAWCKLSILGAYSYDPKTDDKYHFHCIVAKRLRDAQDAFEPTQYPPKRK